MPKKTVKVETLKTLLAEWREREKFCVAEADKLPYGGHFRQAWEARANMVHRCIGELTARIEN